MKLIRAALVAISLCAFTGCDLVSSRQKKLERMLIGVWQSSGEEIEFSPDGTYIGRFASDDPSGIAIVLPGAKVLRQGKWSISEDGRLRMSTEQFLGFGADLVADLFIFTRNCRAKEDLLVGRVDNAFAFQYTRKKR